jgi:hypothetical protein
VSWTACEPGRLRPAGRPPPGRRPAEHGAWDDANDDAGDDARDGARADARLDAGDAGETRRRPVLAMRDVIPARLNANQAGAVASASGTLLPLLSNLPRPRVALSAHTRRGFWALHRAPDAAGLAALTLPAFSGGRPGTACANALICERVQSLDRHAARFRRTARRLPCWGTLWLDRTSRGPRPAWAAARCGRTATTSMPWALTGGPTAANATGGKGSSSPSRSAKAWIEGARGPPRPWAPFHRRRARVPASRQEEVIMKRWTCLMACAVFVGMSVGAQAAGNQSGELTAWERFKAYAHQEKDVAVREGRKLIDATEKQLAQMKQQTNASAKESKTAWKANVEALEAKKKAAQAELNKMAQSTATAWDATKEGFANAYKDLHEAYDKAKSSPGK